MDSLSTCIDAPVPAETDRQSIIDHARKMFWTSDCIEYRHAYDWLLKIEICQEHLPVLYFSRSVEEAYQCFTNAGTIYQFFASSDEYKKCFTLNFNEIEQVEHVTGSTNSISENGTTKCECEADDSKSHSSSCQKKLCEGDKTIFNPKRLLHFESENTDNAAAQLSKEATMDKMTKLFDNSCINYSDNLLQYASSLKWISVGQLPNKSEGSGMCYESLYEQTKNTETQSSVPGFYKDNPYYNTQWYKKFVTALQSFMAHDKYQDYRVLALKVDLYDNLRERSFSQPSGVDYAWATKNPPVRDIISLNSLGQWHYDAIFVTLDVIDAAISNKWKLNVGDMAADVWSLQDPDVRIVPLISNLDKSLGLGHYMWILSHLSYPLAWVIDQFEMVVIGNNKHHRKSEAFIHTAGLVDISEPANKLIFVPSHNVIIGGTNYLINNKGEKIVVYNFDTAIESILDHCLRSPYSLREAFTMYTQIYYFSSGINWPEINSLTTTLIVRWHQKTECYRKDKEAPTMAVGAPASVLKAMGLTPDPEIMDQSYPAYGGTETVNSLDQRYLDREVARRNPAVKLGGWGNIACLVFLTGYAKYNTLNVTVSLDRCGASVHDCLFRARFLRKGFEQWKRTAGQDDRIAFPHDGEKAKLNWIKSTSHLIQDSEKETTDKFAKYFINEHVMWSWEMNRSESSSKTTLTGIRTVSSWWRDQRNTQWFSLGQRPSQQKSDSYVYSTSGWTKGSYAQFGLGLDNPEIERTLMRIDLNANERDWGLTYKSHHCTQQEVPGTCWIVDSSHGGRLAASLGWLKDGIAIPVENLWGWGIALRLKNDCEQVLKTLVIPYKTAGIATGNHFNDGTILFTDQPINPIFGFDKSILDEDVKRNLTTEESAKSSDE